MDQDTRESIVISGLLLAGVIIIVVGAVVIEFVLIWTGAAFLLGSTACIIRSFTKDKDKDKEWKEQESLYRRGSPEPGNR